MKRFSLIMTTSLFLLLLSTQPVLAAPCTGSCQNEPVCGATSACGDNDCPCDKGGICVCVENACKCEAPCNDDKACSTDCPTKSACRPAVAQASRIEKPDTDGNSPKSDSPKTDAGKKQIGRETAGKPAENETSGSLFLPIAAVVIIVGSGIGGALMAAGRRQKNKDKVGP